MTDNREFRTPSTTMATDVVTGEFIGMLGNYQLEGQTKFINKKKKRKSDINSKYGKYGTFYWIFYELSKILFGKIDDSTFVKLIFLLTYMDYDDRVARFGGKNKEAITLEDLPKLLGIKKKQDTDNFIRILEENNIIKVYNNNIYFNCKLFAKGNLRVKKNKQAARVYVDTVRKLYKSTPTRAHKKLAYIYRLIPFVNIKYNVLCKNVEEKNMKKIEMLSMKEFCEIVGYSYENVSRIKKEISSIKINDEHIVMYINFGKSDNSFLAINPKVFCASNDDEAIEFISGMFEKGDTLDKQ